MEVLRRNEQMDKMMKVELKHANHELKTLRTERLKQLYLKEQ